MSSPDPIDELRHLERLTPSDGFKDAVHARLHTPELRRPIWVLPMAMAAGILVGLFGSLALRPDPPPEAPADLRSTAHLDEAMRDHAYRVRTFARQADHARPQLMEADYRVSGLGPSTRKLLEEPIDRLPTLHRRYVEQVARPVHDVGVLIELQQSKRALSRLRALWHHPEFLTVLEGVELPAPRPALTVTLAPVDDAEARDFLQARAYLYERAFGPAMNQFVEFTHRFPESDLADDALFWSGDIALEAGDTAKALNYFVQVADRGWINERQRKRLKIVIFGKDNAGLEGTGMIFVGPGGRREFKLHQLAESLVHFHVESINGHLEIRGTFDKKLQAVLRALEEADPDGIDLELPRRVRMRKTTLRKLQTDDRTRKAVSDLIERFPWIRF